jgi:hypothetical protein
VNSSFDIFMPLNLISREFLKWWVGCGLKRRVNPIVHRGFCMVSFSSIAKYKALSSKVRLKESRVIRKTGNMCEKGNSCG